MHMRYALRVMCALRFIKDNQMLLRRRSTIAVIVDVFLYRLDKGLTTAPGIFERVL
jgi:hypothetical protein